MTVALSGLPRAWRRSPWRAWWTAGSSPTLTGGRVGHTAPRIAQHWPEFAEEGKQDVTVADLMRHEVILILILILIHLPFSIILP